jgi:hypothetical protein
MLIFLKALAILSTCHFVNLPFHRLAISSTILPLRSTSFDRKQS